MEIQEQPQLDDWQTPRAQVDAERNPYAPQAQGSRRAASRSGGGDDINFENDSPRPQRSQINIGRKKPEQHGFLNFRENFAYDVYTPWYKQRVVWIVLAVVAILTVAIVVTVVVVTHKHSSKTTTSQYSTTTQMTSEQSFNFCKLG